MGNFQRESEQRVDELLGDGDRGGIGTIVCFFLIILIVAWTP